MIVTIELVACARYGARMRSLALHLLTLMAVMVLPFAMSTAPAEAHQNRYSVDMPAGHCADEGATIAPEGVAADCTMACSAALPAIDLTSNASHPLSRAPDQPALQQAMSGIQMEIATPPPKQS